MSTIDINGFDVGGEKTYIIAEIGSNFNQDFELAKDSIDAAKESGADAVKFQSLNVDKLYLNPSDNIRELHKRIDFEESYHYSLNEYAKGKGITFFSSPTYLSAIDILEDIDVALYKLASAQTGTFPQLVDKVASLNKPTIFSTGLSNIQEVDRLVDQFRSHGNEKFIILHCNSIYPAPYDRINLGMINTYKERYNCITGFSDHSDGIATAIGAVSMGAKVIEKHFAIDKSLPVPDAPFSLEPNEFKELVSGVRIVEQAMRPLNRNNIEPEESTFKSNILYRLVSNTEISAGTKLGSEHVSYYRNSEGIDCRDEHLFLGKELNVTVPANTLLTKEHFK